MLLIGQNELLQKKDKTEEKVDEFAQLVLFLLCWRNHPDYSANLNIYGKPFEACQLQESVQDSSR